MVPNISKYGDFPMPCLITKGTHNCWVWARLSHRRTTQEYRLIMATQMKGVEFFGYWCW